MKPKDDTKKTMSRYYEPRNIGVIEMNGFMMIIYWGGSTTDYRFIPL